MGEGPPLAMYRQTGKPPHGADWENLNAIIWIFFKKTLLLHGLIKKTGMHHSFFKWVENHWELKGGSKNYFASRFSAFFIGDENF